jgi:type VI protein secretion system component VasK
MAKPAYRSNPFRTNSYQRRMIKVPFISVFILNALGSFLIIFFHPHLMKILLPFPQTADYANEIAIGVLFIIWVFFLLVTIWSFMVSSNLVGAFERITRELDAVIDGRRKKVLKVREEDHPANELIERINMHIQSTDFNE